MPVEPKQPFSGALSAKWYASEGMAAKKSTEPDLLKARDLLRAALALNRLIDVLPQG